MNSSVFVAIGMKLKPFLRTDFQRPKVLHFPELRLQCFGFGFREEIPCSFEDSAANFIGLLFMKRHKV